MKNIFIYCGMALSLFCMDVSGVGVAEDKPTVRKAAAPLYRDPITDGAADPVLIWNRQEKTWWMLYTQRRANQETADVAYCYGNGIGIAESADNGKTWVYRGTLDLNFERGHNTFWAPDVVYHDGKYHLFVSYIKGVRNHWGGQAHIVHFVSDNLWDWEFKGSPKLSSDKVIDCTLMKGDDNVWRMWYKDEMAGAHTMLSESKDLDNWSPAREAIGGGAHEGPKAFKYAGYYWMVTDEWHGMRVYKSSDLEKWEKQGLILDKPSQRKDDTPSGAHGDVVVLGDKAYVFYFTHPGRKSHTQDAHDVNGNVPYELRRSSIQVAPLEYINGTLVSNRDIDFDFYLPEMAD